MARIAKKGLEYFPFDTDFFQDMRIRKLIKYQNGKAVTVYALLLCIIYKEGYYIKWDKELPFCISELTGFDEGYITEVIKCCITIGLFDRELFENEKVLTSKGIQSRYCNIQGINRRMAIISEHALIKPRRHPAASASLPKSSPSRSADVRRPEPLPGLAPPPVPAPATSPSTSITLSQQYLDKFFAPERLPRLEKLSLSLGLPVDGIDQLRSLAQNVVNEWELAEKTHTGFTDFSRHLISTVRERLQERKKAPETRSKSAPPKTDADYIRAIDSRRASRERSESESEPPVTSSQYLASKGASCQSVIDLIPQSKNTGNK
jgi:dnaD domain protein